ncbi:hypothetical protein LUZ60_007785 [Juncus effusus]|nr:hypothetical protein LUZ60_007785 [Juncus effusus]
MDFNPDRFEDREIDLMGQKDFELLPFGGGRRGYPGYSFALATTEITLASLLYHFEWELPPGFEVENIDTSEIFGLATRKKEPLVLVARNSEGFEFRGDLKN